jgi:hypothetical protein
MTEQKENQDQEVVNSSKRGRKQFFTQAHKDEIISLRQQGYKYHDIAVKMQTEDGKLRTSIISRVCKDVIIPKRTEGKGGWTQKPRVPKEKEQTNEQNTKNVSIPSVGPIIESVKPIKQDVPQKEQVTT